MIDIEAGQMSDWDSPTGPNESEDERLHGSVDGRQTDAAWAIDSEGERLSRSICGSEDGRLGGRSPSGCDSEDDQHGLVFGLLTAACLLRVHCWSSC